MTDKNGLGIGGQDVKRPSAAIDEADQHAHVARMTAAVWAYAEPQHAGTPQQVSSSGSSGSGLENMVISIMLKDADSWDPSPMLSPGLHACRAAASVLTQALLQRLPLLYKRSGGRVHRRIVFLSASTLAATVFVDGLSGP